MKAPVTGLIASQGPGDHCPTSPSRWPLADESVRGIEGNCQAEQGQRGSPTAIANRPNPITRYALLSLATAQQHANLQLRYRIASTKSSTTIGSRCMTPDDASVSLPGTLRTCFPSHPSPPRVCLITSCNPQDTTKRPSGAGEAWPGLTLMVLGARHDASSSDVASDSHARARRHSCAARWHP